MPICIDSTFIPPHKANLNTTILEMAGIVWVLVKFHQYTAGAPLVKIYCDSASMVNALKDISQIADPMQLKLILIIA